MIASAVILCYSAVCLEYIVGGSTNGSPLVPITNSNKGQKYELESIILR